MRQIPLTQGQFALVDDADYPALARWIWCARKEGKTYYAMRNSRKSEGQPRRLIRMHQAILGPPAAPGLTPDHLDRNGLNNQRENLRWATSTLQMQNRGKPKHNKSGFVGVSWAAKSDKWQAHISLDGKSTYLGLYDTPELASEVVEAVRSKHWKRVKCG